MQTRNIPQLIFSIFFFTWLPSYLQETEEPSSLWGTIKLSAHCCAAIINAALRCLPLVAHVRRMNRQCTQLQPFSSVRGDNCHSHFCQIKKNLPDVLRCPQKTPGFHILQAIQTPVCGFKLSCLGWTFCIYCAAKCCAWTFDHGVKKAETFIHWVMNVAQFPLKASRTVPCRCSYTPPGAKGAFVHTPSNGALDGMEYRRWWRLMGSLPEITYLSP